MKKGAAADVAAVMVAVEGREAAVAAVAIVVVVVNLVAGVAPLEGMVVSTVVASTVVPRVGLEVEEKEEVVAMAAVAAAAGSTSCTLFSMHLCCRCVLRTC